MMVRRENGEVSVYDHLFYCFTLSLVYPWAPHRHSFHCNHSVGPQLTVCPIMQHASIKPHWTTGHLSTELWSKIRSEARKLP